MSRAKSDRYIMEGDPQSRYFDESKSFAAQAPK